MVAVPPPLFILGSQGSGSTLLRLMLDAHPNIAIPQETGFLRLVTAHRWVPFWELGGNWHQRLGMTDADLDRRLGEMYGGMFAAYAAQQGKRRWGEKTPFHMWHIEDMVRLFPDAVFIGIVRHPLSAIASVSRRFDRKMHRAIGHWTGTTRELVHQSASLGDRLRVVRYEELTRSPEPVLRELLGWLGEPWSDDVLAHHVVSRRSHGTTVVEGNTRADQPVDAGRIDKWQDWLGEADRQRVSDKTLPWARFLGYGDVPGAPLVPLTSDGRLLASGSDLGARRTLFPDLDFSPPPRPRREDPLRPRTRKHRRRRAPRGAAALAEHLPPKVQRGLREARRGRKAQREG